MHPQVELTTPRFWRSPDEASAGIVTVDEELKDIILDIWDLEGPGGYCRTIYSCQASYEGTMYSHLGKGPAYIMFEAGFEAPVTQILNFYGKRVLSIEDCWNCKWPRAVWSSVRFE